MDSSTESLPSKLPEVPHKMCVPLGCLNTWSTKSVVHYVHLRYLGAIFSWASNRKHSISLPSPELEKLTRRDDLDWYWSGCWHIVLDRHDSGAYGRGKKVEGWEVPGYSDFQRPVCPWVLIFGRLWNSLIMKSLLKVQNDNNKKTVS